jgi:hypothetical protein
VIGVQAAGGLFDAHDFLIALGSDQLTVQLDRPVSQGVG